MNPNSKRNNLLRTATLAALFLSLSACSKDAQTGLATPQLSGLEVAAPQRNELIFSGVQANRTGAQRVTLRNVGGEPLELTGLALAGADAAAFSLTNAPTLPVVIEPQGSLSADVSFAPGRTGNHSATLSIESSDPASSSTTVGLYGLGTKGEQGENEPPLQQVVDTLGYTVDVGGSTLELGSSESAIGSESLAPLFTKAGDGPVTLTVVARYGPNDTLPYGYFTLAGGKPERTEVGQIGAADAQRLLPPLSAGSSEFDPGTHTFGVYAQAGGETQYSADTFNFGSVKHALRVYPLIDRSGAVVPNSYLIGLEEARNADYQDAVFVISNVKPADAAANQNLGGWEPLFNGQNLDGWYSYLPDNGLNSDPEGIFRAENGMIHILGVPNNGYRAFGYLATESSYKDYQLRLEYKWGSKRFAPRDRSKRDSGVIYHFGGADRIWPTGVEYQIQEGDTGDFWMLGGPTLETTVETPHAHEPQYQPDGQPYTSRSGDFIRIMKNGTFDHNDGWNTVEITVQGNTATHRINGEINNRAYSLFDKNGSPLTSGKILLQAEGAEIYYRNVAIRPLGE